MRSRAPLVGVGIALLLALLFYFFAWRPLSEQQEALATERQDLEAREISLRSQIARLLALRDDELEIQAELARLQELIPSGPAQPTAIRQLQVAADQAGVVIASVEFAVPSAVPTAPQTGVPGTVLAEIPLTMTISGGYFQMVDFLRRLEVDTPRAILVDSIAIAESEAEFPTLATAWEGSLFAVVATPPSTTGAAPVPQPSATVTSTPSPAVGG